MKCPVCEGEGQTSKVYPDGFGSTTAMLGETYWDEEGVWHSHDPNTSSEGYSCSRGHIWTVVQQQACPAGDWAGSRQVRIRQATR